MRWIIATVVLGLSLSEASVKDAGLNMGDANIDGKVEELLLKAKTAGGVDLKAFANEYLIANDLKLSVEEAHAVMDKISDPEKTRDDRFIRQVAKVLDLTERLNNALLGCPATKSKKVSSLVKKGKAKDIKHDLVVFVDEWVCPKEEDPTRKKKFESKIFGSSGLQWQYFEDMRTMLKKSPKKAMDKLMRYAKEAGMMSKDTPPMVAMVMEQLVQNPEVAEYGITAIDWAETFFKSESGRRINGMLPSLMEADTEAAMEMFSKEADYNQEMFFKMIDNSDVADGFLKSVAKYVVMANTWVREALADNMKFAMANGFLVSNKMPVIDR